jgi:flagellar assembly factor FliW
MPVTVTRYFGELTYDQDGVFCFPIGIPGFETQRRFLFIEQQHTHPVVFMQSLDQPDLCFLAVPVSVAVPNYSLELAPEEHSTLGLTENLAFGSSGITCLGLITCVEGGNPTINLASPIVLNLEKRIGIQAIPAGSRYSLRHPLLAREEAIRCS